MSSTISTASLLPTLAASPDKTSLFPASASSNSPSIETITFGILSAILAIGSIILTYLQLVRMRREQPKAEHDCEIHVANARSPSPLRTDYFIRRSISFIIESPCSLAQLPEARLPETQLLQTQLSETRLLEALPPSRQSHSAS
ncbi:hypothetical protein VE03_02953 [Pseudogymnoascus sp. 23342-1-I1]|nr:hypothetical protein VE03_02953 [Pseudogymnoascus sp. 23342-1-I1]